MHSAILIIIGSFFLIFFLKLLTSGEKKLFNLLAVSFFLHLCILFFIQADLNRYYSPSVALSRFFNDGEAYSGNALIIANTLNGIVTNNDFFRRTAGVEIVSDEVMENAKKFKIPAMDVYEVGFITYFYAIVYAAYGFAPAFINFLNICFYLLTAYLIFSICKDCFNRMAAYIAAFLFLFWPTIFFYSGLKLKDSMISFSLYLLFFACLKIKKIYVSIALIVVTLLMVELLRPHSAQIIIMALLVYYGITFLAEHKKLVPVAAGSLAIAAFVLRSKIHSLLLKGLVRAAISQAIYYTNGGVVYALVGDKDNYLNYSIFRWLRFMAQAWYHLLFEPTISNLKSFEMIVYYPFKIIFLMLFVLAIFGFSFALKQSGRRGYILLAVFFIVYGTIVAMSSGNVGTMLRHRDAIMPIIFIFSAYLVSVVYPKIRTGRG